MPPEEAKTPAEILISGLLQLHRDHDKDHDTTARGKLANLRYGLRDRLHADYPIGRVFPALTAGSLTFDDERNEWHTVVAALFGYAHDDVPDIKGVTLGTASRRLYDKLDRESLERRFMAMLNSDDEHLPGYLRQTMSLLKSESVGLDWGQLLKDVCRWNEPGKPIQKCWTRDYYRARRADDTTETTAETAENASDTDTDNTNE